MFGEADLQQSSHARDTTRSIREISSPIRRPTIRWNVLATWLIAIFPPCSAWLLSGQNRCQAGDHESKPISRKTAGARDAGECSQANHGLLHRDARPTDLCATSCIRNLRASWFVTPKGL